MKKKSKDPAICSRCGEHGQNYICGPCKVALTVLGQQRKEANSPAEVEQRRKYKREWIAAKRALSKESVK